MTDFEFVPPCQAACPILTDVQGYVSLAALGKFGEAFEVARVTNPFVSSCGFICVHPCEKDCRRASVDKEISIMTLKRAADEHRKTEAGSVKSEAKINKSAKKVAVIGAGPAGLTAALDLTQMGFGVEVFERERKAGGMLHQVIPLYRQPTDALNEDINRIEEAGVKINYGRKLGVDITLDSLKAGGFSAIIVATGLPLSRSLPVFPKEHRSVLLALPFLKEVKEGKRPVIGDEVIVVGGGNVAIDVARSAKRLGATKVKIVCLESDTEMPAHDWEIEQAAEEGIEFNCCWGPKEMIGTADNVEALRCQGVKSVFDADGRFNPTFFEDKLTEIEGDTIIVSIGQMRENGILGDEEKAVYEGKSEGVFLTGETKEGPGSAVGAMKSGHNTADEVYRYLAGEEAIPDEPQVIVPLNDEIKNQLKGRDRVLGGIRPGPERLSDFDIFEAGLASQAASKEALRCLTCAAGAKVNSELCVACLTCVRVCPYEIPKIGTGNVAEIDPNECQACGICVTECPALAIQFRRTQESDIISDIEKALGQSKNLELYCQKRLFFEEDKGPQFGWARVRVLCAAHVSTRSILKAYELGAEKVTILGCPTDECSFKDGQMWSTRRIAETKAYLRQIGIEEESIVWKGQL